MTPSTISTVYLLIFVSLTIGLIVLGGIVTYQAKILAEVCEWIADEEARRG